MEFRTQKELLIVISTIVLTALEFFVAALILPEPGLTGPLLVLVALSLSWSLVMVLALGLARHWSSVISLITVAALSVVLAGGFSPGSLVGGLLLAASLMLARRFAANEISNRISYKTTDVFFPALKLVLLGLVLALAGLASPILERSLTEGHIEITAEQVNYATDPFRPLFERALPGLTADTTIDELIDQRIAEEAPEGTNISTEQRSQIYEQVASRLGAPVDGTDSLNQAVANRMNGWLESFTVTSPVLFALVIILLVVIAVRAFVPLVAWALLPLLVLLVWLGRRTTLLRLSERTATVEQLSF